MLETERQKVNDNYKKLFEKLQEYEMTGIEFYADNDRKQCVLLNPGHEYEEVLRDVPAQLGNPYSEIIEWIKHEIYDLEGL